MFSCEFCEISKNAYFLKRTSGDYFWRKKTDESFFFFSHTFLQNLNEQNHALQITLECRIYLRGVLNIYDGAFFEKNYRLKVVDYICKKSYIIDVL